MSSSVSLTRVKLILVPYLKTVDELAKDEGLVSNMKAVLIGYMVDSSTKSRVTHSISMSSSLMEDGDAGGFC
jgi:hypothetical protein